MAAFACLRAADYNLQRPHPIQNKTCSWAALYLLCAVCSPYTAARRPLI